MSEVKQYLNVYSGDVKAISAAETIAGMFSISTCEARRIISDWLRGEGHS